MTDLLFIVLGLLLLGFGGEGLVRGSVTIAEKLNLSTLLISTIVIGFGTSAPELVVSVNAALSGAPEISLGNVIGSNISNTLLILGVASLLVVIPCRTMQIKYDAAMGLFASSVLSVLAIIGYINRLMGTIMLAMLIVYLLFIIIREKKARRHHQTKASLDAVITDVIPLKKTSFPMACLITLGGLALLVIGSNFLVNGAIAIATKYQVSQAVIGLTIVAIGTSLPELATAAIAAWRNEPDIIIGNILGSNLFNLFSIIGITAMVKPIPFAGQLAAQDVWVMLGTSVLAFIIVVIRKKMTRIEGASLLSIYGLYLTWLYHSI